MPETTYIKAITSTLAEAMRADERVFVLGEDVAEGGPYTATAGLAEEFGTERVINTPISEAAITGVAIGAAQSGMRPVLEIMFIDFITLALDQLVNGAAKAHFMSGGQLTVPLVLRTQGGAGYRGAAQHSQSLESWLTHVPGPQGRDAEPRGRRRRAARERDRRPEPGRLHREQDALLPQGATCPSDAAPVPIGEAVTLREGGDVTIVALSRLVHDALAAAERLAAEDGIEAEVIDPRTLVPLDLDDDRRVGQAHRPARRRPRGRRARRLRRRDRRAGPGGGVRLPRRADRARRRAVRADPAQPAARGRLPAGRGRDRGGRAGDVAPHEPIRAVVSGCLTMKEVRVYDYVIVGAGSAGCVLAARLSEDPDVKVALLEAGGPDSRPEIAMPMAFPMLLKSSVDWDLYGEPEPGLGGRRLYLPRGKVIGGSGSINAMIYVRGNRADYDGWAAGGAEGWSYDEVLPYFKRSEDNERGEDAFHGVGGPLSVSDSRAMSPLIETMIEASRARRPRAQPRLQRRPPGGRRALPAHAAQRAALLDRRRLPAPGRRRGRTSTSSPTRWRCGSCSRARAPSASRSTRDGEVEEIRAEREVILSAGAYQSPVLLMISGIGPAEDLEPYGIEVRENLPVGHNLQDHCMAQLNYETDEPSLFGAFNAGELRAARERGPRAADLQHPRGRRRSSARGPSSTRPTWSSTTRRRCSTTRG